MSRLREGDVAVLLADLEKVAAAHAPEAVDKVRSLRGHLDHVGTEGAFADLIREVVDVLATNRTVMEVQRPIIDRGVAALEALAETERKRVDLATDEGLRQREADRHAREMERLRMQRIWIPIVTTALGALASGTGVWAVVGS